jgi:membrane protease YdiL (CAAX protease family)
MTSWAWLGLTLALLGPGAIALLWKRTTRDAVSVSRSAPCLGLFVLLLAAVAAIGHAGRLRWRDLGFTGMSWASVPLAIMLTWFFVAVYGPVAAWVLRRLRPGSFDAGQRALADLPRWYLGWTIIVVGAGEEWLYRGYAIEQFRVLGVDAAVAGLVSLLAFGLVHLPVWGIGVSLTTLVSGGIFTVLYLWHRDVSFLILAHVATDLRGLLAASVRPPDRKR